MTDQSRGVPPPILKAIDDVRSLGETIWSSFVGLKGDQGNARLLFTSTEDQAGTTLVAASTAMCLARNTRSEVLLVEAQLQRPAAAAYFGLGYSRGLSDILVGQATLDDVRRNVQGCPGLTVIPAGTARETVAGEFAARAASDLLASIAGSARYVIFDAPPLLRHSESRALLSHVDGAVLVLRARASRKVEVRRAVEVIESANVEVVGTVLNRFKSELPFEALD